MDIKVVMSANLDYIVKAFNNNFELLFTDTFEYDDQIVIDDEGSLYSISIRNNFD